MHKQTKMKMASVANALDGQHTVSQLIKQRSHT